MTRQPALGQMKRKETLRVERNVEAQIENAKRNVEGRENVEARAQNAKRNETPLRSKATYTPENRPNHIIHEPAIPLGQLVKIWHFFPLATKNPVFKTLTN